MTDTAVIERPETQVTAEVMERVIVGGDLAKLTAPQRIAYYRRVCESLGLNPLTAPFLYITVNDGRGGSKLMMYATKTATDQLRTLKGISIDKAERDSSDPDYATWVVTGHDATGRVDTEIGSVSIAGLKGEGRANAIMKALTKGKRRLTLSLAGLGWLDEVEVDSIPTAARVDVDLETGEIQRGPLPLREQIAERAAQLDTPRPSVAAQPDGDGLPPHPVAEPAQSDGSAMGPAPQPRAPGVEPGVCGASSPIDGAACVRETGHAGHHRDAEKQSW